LILFLKRYFIVGTFEANSKLRTKRRNAQKKGKKAAEKEAKRRRLEEVS
jgi:uncharacterized membrane protein